MALSGLVGASAVGGLEDLIAQQLLKEKFAEQQRAQQMEEAQRASQMAQQDKQFSARMAQDAEQFQGTMDSQAAARRQRANEAGVEDMLRQAALMQPKPVKLTKITTKGPNGRPVAKGVTDEELMQGVEEYREPKAAGGSEDKRQWLTRNGQPIYDTYRPGDAPFDRTRQQARPVLSSDANNIADIDNSISMLDGLKASIGKTGASSAMGAMVPNVVSELTGIGSDAKERQAMINGAKQIIGKALEGGVLRKEDEAKYARILPTIGDPPEVAEAKIDALKTTLQQKRDTVLESLSAAGYGVDNFNRSAPPKPVPSHGGGEQRPIPGIPGAMAESTDGGKTWKRVK